MSQHHDDFDDFLRGALHTAVDQVEPAGDGLEQIRARLTPPRPLPVAWLVAACSWVARRARGSLDSVSAWLRIVPIETHRRDGAAVLDGPHMQRLRVVATVAAVAVLMAISVTALTPFGQHVIAQAGSVLNSIGSGGGGVPAGTGEPGPSGDGNGAAGPTGAGPGTQNQGQPVINCASSAPSLAVPSASPASPAPATSASPAASPTPCGSPAASPSPSPASPSPSSPSPTSPSPSSPSPSSPSPSSPSPTSPSPTSPSPSSPSPTSPSPTSPSPSSPSPSSPSSGPDSTGPDSTPAASPAVSGSG